MDMICVLFLFGVFEDVGVIIVVGDQVGCLLWIEGDSQLCFLIDGMGFVVGVNWLEEVVGMSVLGMVLVFGELVQICGVEYYNCFVYLWLCLVVFVCDLEIQCVFGVIDIIGGIEVVSFQVCLFIDVIVWVVELELLVVWFCVCVEVLCSDFVFGWMWIMLMVRV